MTKKTERLHLSVTQEEKEFIKTRSSELGFTSMTAFINRSVKSDRDLRIDKSDFYEFVNETRSINRNIRSLINDISPEALENIDLTGIEESMLNIEKMVKEREQELDQLEKDFNKMPNKKLLEILKGEL